MRISKGSAQFFEHERKIQTKAEGFVMQPLHGCTLLIE
jgi:hypothetical protein